MPAMTDVEMASLLDPDLNRRPQSSKSDAEALRSQLMSNIEQNKLAFVANKASIKGDRTSVQQAGLQDGQPSDDDDSQGSESDEDTDHESEKEANDQESDNEGVESDGDDQEDVAQVAANSGSEDYDMEDADPVAVNGDHSSKASRSSRETSSAASETDLVATDRKGLSAKVKDVEGDDNEEDGNDEVEYEDAESTPGDIDGDTVTFKPAKALRKQTPEAEIESDSEEEDDDVCVFCGLTDPGNTSKEPDLSCNVCRRPAHHTCASAQSTIPIEPDSWRCANCTENRTSESPKETSNRPRHSASRLVRDLLPVSRGLQKPGAHSIFAQPLIPDDDGGRSLRKRRSDPDERGPRHERPRKKMKETPPPEMVDEDTVTHATRRSSQKLAPILLPMRTARVLQHRPFHKPPPHKFILAFRLDQEKIAAILAEPPRPSRRKYLKKKQKILVVPPNQPPVPKFPALPTHHLIFPATFGDRENDVNAKPYGGILSDADAETSRSLPQMRDREIFEIARKEAEEERKKSTEKAEAEMNSLGEGANATKSKRTVSGPPSKIKCIQFGKHVIDTSYAAPYPEEYSHESRLFICEFCLKYLPSEFVAWRHKLKCPAKHPPGDEIYRDGSLSIWEVDGRKKTEYCQCLCLMAKLFLGSKTLYYDVDPFLFYILTEYDEYGYHFVGYFSKEKRPASQNNVSCILVMPIHQRKGYATFLIEFSYLLTRIEGKEGSPEKPLSDMGLTAYRSYWDLTLSRHLLELSDKPFSVKDIMLRTGMTADDVVHSLERLYAFVKDPVTKTYAIRYDRTLYETIIDKYDSKDFRKIREDRLIWTPYIMGRSDAAALDAQPVNAVAQREETIATFQLGTEEGRISPKTTEDPNQEPADEQIDPALLSSVGNIAPGPPSTDNVVNIEPAEPLPEDSAALSDKGKSPADPALTGYALAYQVEKIPPTRFQIDPPIPPAMLRYAKSRRKSAVGTPKANGKLENGKAATPQVLRSSPRKAASASGSTPGPSSNRTTPDRGGASVRRSGRKSGLANEIVTTDDSEQDQDEEAVIDEDDEEDEIELKRAPAEDTIEVTSGDTSSGEEEESDRSETGSSADEDEDEVEAEQDSAPDDPDAEVDEDEEDESSEEEEEINGDEIEADIVSAVSSAAVSDAQDSESTDDEE